jgi:hypothetical protein
MVAVPRATPVITPVEELIVAILVCSELHAIVLFVAFSGDIVAVAVVFEPTANVGEGKETTMPVTGWLLTVIAAWPGMFEPS